MSNRSLVIVAVVAAVLVLLAIVGQNTSTSTISRGEMLLPGLQDALNDIDEIKLIKADNETIATLERTAGEWTVAEKSGYPADVGKLRQALLALSEARIVEEKTANEEFYDRLGVESVELAAASGTALSIRHDAEAFPTVILGDATGTTYRYARRAEESRSYLLDRDPDLPRNTAQWLNPDVLDVRGARVQRVTITHADGERVEISKANSEQTNFTVADVPQDRELLYAGVADVIGNSLRELKLEDVDRLPADQLTADVTTEFVTFDGLIVIARAIQRDEQTWVSFEASFDTQQVIEFATTPVTEGLAQARNDDAGEDPQSEADTINSTVAGWRYGIPSYQYDQMTRRMSDLLKVSPEAPD